MAIVWYYRAEDGREQGPVNSSQLKRLADFGKVRPNTEVRLAQEDRWGPASQVDGLFPEGAASAVGSSSSPSPVASAVAAHPVQSPSPAPQPGMSYSIGSYGAASSQAGPSQVAPSYSPAPTYSPAPSYAPAPFQQPAHPVSAAPGAGLEWYCQMSGRLLGPLRVEELRDLARLGRVEPNSPIARGASGPWYPATDLAGTLGLSWGAPAPMGTPMPIAQPMPAPMAAPIPVAAPMPMPMAQPYATQPLAHAPYPPRHPSPPPRDQEVVMAEVVPAPAPPRTAHVAALPQTHPMFVLFLVGGIALALVGVAVTSYIVMSAGREPAPGQDSPRTLAKSARRTHEALAPRVDRESPTGLNGRPKERGDRFQDFARQAGNVTWDPQADAKTKADIAQREKRIMELLVELSADFVTEPLEEDFKQMRTEYQEGKVTSAVYLESLDNLQKALRRPAKGASK